MDATKLSVPFGTMAAIFGSILSAIVWAIFKFETKDDAKNKADTHEKLHETIDSRISKHEAIVIQVATDVSYIRGRIEPKG